MSIIDDLTDTINKLAVKGKGILAADESVATIAKRFAALQIESTETTRRNYRDMLMTTPNINKFIAGVILFEETLNQRTLDGKLFPEKLASLGILTGIKVDKGLVILPNTQDEQISQGLDNLTERLAQYKNQGACFAKWRAVYRISSNTPSSLAIKSNAECLARYAAICQAVGIVPIVEPEVLIDGDHSLERCLEVTEPVLHNVFNALFRHKVKLEYIVLKPSMVIYGKQSTVKATPEQVAKATLTVLLRCVPAAVPTINFLSGGQSAMDATMHLNAIHHLSNQLPWNVSYSYARALQDDAMRIWKGNENNISAAQQAFYKRAQLNSLASQGKYLVEMEKEMSIA